MFKFMNVRDNSHKVRPLNIFIVGAGKVGATLVETLSGEGNDITVIDTNRDRINDLTNQYDVMGIVGNGASFNLLNEAGIEDCDLFIAVTRSDELNLLCCTIAKRSSDLAAIARVRSPEYSNDIRYLKDRLGLAMIINPDLETAREASRILFLPTAMEINSFAHGQAEMIKFKIPEGSVLDGMSLVEFGKFRKNINIIIAAIERKKEIIIPYGDSVMKSGDIVSFVAAPKSAKEFMRSISINNRSVHSCMIIGGGRTAYYLASILINMHIEVKVIERDRARCEEFTTLVPDAIVINGDGTDENLLIEEGLDSTEAFVPLTGMDEENIMLSLHAKKESNAKVVAKVNRTTFKNVIDEMDIESVLYPKYITSDAIIAYARAKRASANSSNVETLYRMFDNRVEAIEFKVDKKSAVTDTPLRDLDLQHNLNICFISHKGKLIYPTGNDMIHVGDTVMIVTTTTGYTDITDIIK